MSLETVQTIQKNAERLLADARVLARDSSFRSAIPFAVLSMEESGKACMVRWILSGYLPRENIADQRAGHIRRQARFLAHRTLQPINGVGGISRKGSLELEASLGPEKTVSADEIQKAM